MTQVTDEEIDAVAAAAEGEEKAAPAAPPEPPKPVRAKPLEQFVDTEQLKRDVAIDPNDLDTAMIEHASLYVHYATKTAGARRQYERMKAALEILQAQLDDHYRTSMKAANPKTTEAAITAAVQQDPRWSAAQTRLIESQTHWKLAEVAESAFEQRKDMILELARDRRREKEGQVRVSEVSSIRDAVIEGLRQRQAGQA